MSSEKPPSNIAILTGNKEAIPKIVERKRALIQRYTDEISEIEYELEEIAFPGVQTSKLRELVRIGLERRVEGRRRAIQLVTASMSSLDEELSYTNQAIELAASGYIKEYEINNPDFKPKRRVLKNVATEQQVEPEESEPTISDRINLALFNFELIGERINQLHVRENSPHKTLVTALRVSPKSPTEVDELIERKHRNVRTRGRTILSNMKDKLTPHGLNIHGTHGENGLVVQYRLAVIPTEDEARQLVETIESYRESIISAIGSVSARQDAIKNMYEWLAIQNPSVAQTMLLIAGWWNQYTHRSYQSLSATPQHVPSEMSRAIAAFATITRLPRQV